MQQNNSSHDRKQKTLVL